MRIIAVDDEKLALKTLTDSIARAVPEGMVNGFRMPDEALRFAGENGCDVAFLDIRMRGMTGLELARRLKEQNPDVNIIFVTGFSEYTLDAFRMYASDYLLKPATPEAVKQAMEHLRNPVKTPATAKIQVQCFGNFEVFHNGKPIMFGRQKTKELFAYLVDRMGTSCTMGELMAVLWEDGPDTCSRSSNLRNLIHDLKQTLSAIGADGVILKKRNAISLNRNEIDCDYYDFLRHIPYAVNRYRGEYMLQYSWAEITTATLPSLRTVE